MEWPTGIEYSRSPVTTFANWDGIIVCYYWLIGGHSNVKRTDANSAQVEQQTVKDQTNEPT